MSILYRGLQFHPKDPLKSFDMAEFQSWHDPIVNAVQTNGDHYIKRGNSNGRSIPNPLFRHNRDIAAVETSVRQFIEGNTNGCPTRSSEAIENARFACGDFFGAHQWVTEQDFPGLVLEVEIPLERLAVDPVDFLSYFISGLLTYQRKFNSNAVLNLANAYGEKILEYIAMVDRVAATANSNKVLGLSDVVTDLISLDADIIAAHVNSQVRLLGKANMAYQSSFIVMGGIAPTEIREIHIVSPTIPAHEDSIGFLCWSDGKKTDYPQAIKVCE